MMKTKELCETERENDRKACLDGRVLSNMQEERADGMRGAKERSVVVVFVSKQAKLAANPLSPYLSPASHHLCSLLHNPVAPCR